VTEPHPTSPAAEPDGGPPPGAEQVSVAPDGDANAGAAATGDSKVDEALARLRELDSLPAAEQVPVLEDIHRRLQDALADLDEG
jgi:hypothetical protein